MSDTRAFVNVKSRPQPGIKIKAPEPQRRRFKSDFPDTYTRLFIVPGLRMPKLIVGSILIQNQLLMIASLDNLTLFKHGNLVAEAAGGQPVADVNGGLILHDFVKLRINLILRHRIKGSGGLIQYDKGRILDRKSVV